MTAAAPVDPEATAPDPRLRLILTKLDALAQRLGRRFPSPCTVELGYQPADNDEWTPGFWTGLLWLAYQHTGAQAYREAALGLLPSFAARLERGGRGVETHDLGFLYTLSCVAGWRLTGDTAARTLALWAAALLRTRFLRQARVIQAWGSLDDPEQRGRIIIDSVMNMPLLFWAAAETGDRAGFEMACQHLAQVDRLLVRSDGSSAQTVYVDVVTGDGRYGRTHQGFADDSCWSRGQAWAIYGFSLGYRYAREPRLLDAARATADYFLRRLPSDRVCYWDLVFDERDRQEKDTSAAAIAAAGLLELSELLPPQAAPRYRVASLEVLEALAAHASSDPGEDGLLLHGVYDRPHGTGVNESCLWGDYFYAEALMRTRGRWASFW
jgi:unsaturated chondroitin disaccharide hydrolase